jgi:hypothetical protein
MRARLHGRQTTDEMKGTLSAAGGM